MQTHLVYSTFPNAQAATSLARTLLEQRLIACANILPGVISHYWWEGKLEESSEVILIAKTTEEQVESVIEQTRSLHPYDTPCIVVLPIHAGNPDFLHWIAQEVKQSGMA